MSGAAPHPRRGLVLMACMMATFTAAIESTIVAAAMPSIVAEVRGADLYSWVFSAYLLTQAVTIPLYGRLADLYGRKPVFVAGAVLFLLGSALCGLAGGMGTLILFRAVQGLGAGAVQPIAYTIVGDLYTPVERARVQGMLSGVFGAAALLGPAFGALLVQAGSWRAVFWINLPVIAAAIVMVAAFLREDTVPRRHRLDLAGAVLLALGIGAIVLAANRWQRIGAANALLCAGLGLASLLLLVRHERRTPEPMIPASLRTNAIIRVGSLGAFTVGVTIMSVVAFLPSVLQGPMGRGAGTAGLVLGIMMVVWTLGSVAAGRMMVRVPYRVVGRAGALLMIGGALMLVALAPESPVLLAVLGSSVLGVGLGFCNTTWIVSVQTQVAHGQRGSATSAVLFMRFLGQALGAAAGGILLSLALGWLVPEADDPLGRLLDPNLPRTLADASHDALARAVSRAFRGVFAMTALMGFATFLLASRLPPGVSAGSSRLPSPSPAAPTRRA